MSLRSKHTSKKGASRRRRNSNYEGGDSDDETGSVVNAGTASPQFRGDEDFDESDEEPETTLEDTFKDCLENLSDKRAAIRENGLRGLKKLMMENCFSDDFVEDRRETLLDSCLRCIRRGKAAEQSLALETISVGIVHVDGGAREPMFNDASQVIQTTVRDPTASLTTRVASANTLGFTCFMACRDPDRMAEYMQILAQQMDPNTSDLCEAALHAWTLLLSGLPVRRARPLFDGQQEKLQKLMTASDVDVRLAASEALAVLVELCRAADEDFDIDAADELDELIQDLSALSTDSDRRKAKKERSKQRSHVRGILHYVERRDEVEETLHVGQETVEITGWRSTVQLEAMRSVLASGLQVHLMGNMSIRSIFGMGPPPLENALRPSERHAMHKQLLQQQYQPQKKSRAQGRAYARDCKHDAYDDYD